LVALLSQAKSGHWPFSNNIRYAAELGAAPRNFYLGDYRIVNIGRDSKALEALTRRIYTDNPQAVIVSPIIPEDGNSNGQVDDLTQAMLDTIEMAAHYGVHLVDYRQEVIDRVAGGELLSVYMSDIIHPTAYGQQICAEMIEAAIVANGWLTPENHSVLPARLYDNGTYEAEPTRTLGTGYDAISGTGWVPTGTRIVSSTAGDTVTYSATCQQFGIYRADSASPLIDVQIDGGDWLLSQVVTHNGFYGGDLTYGPHTIVFRVRSGYPIRIDELWAI
jgi:hypothetical protein